MKHFDLSEMVKGWFVGNFTPSVHQTNLFEVAVKRYKSGDYEPAHFHKIATEITVIAEGKVRMNGIEYSNGSIIVIKPNETSDFFAITDVITTVVKFPCVTNDKYN
jgi:quercetin dioxygenase-like cupin family protein